MNVNQIDTIDKPLETPTLRALFAGLARELAPHLVAAMKSATNTGERIALSKLPAEQRTPAMRAAKAGRLRAVKVGRAWFALAADVEAFFAAGGAAPKVRAPKPEGPLPADPFDRALAEGRLTKAVRK